MADIVSDTEAYERWLGSHLTLVDADLERKHAQMARAALPFLRATFYRWIGQFREQCPELCGVAEVLSVGDLHIENFGTWRDAEGRLAWGVNDFDEAAPLPWTQDLVRLAASVQLAIEAETLGLGRSEACDELLAGYEASLSSGGRPFVLAERHEWLRKLALEELRDPSAYWKKLEALPEAEPPPAARAALVASLPDGVTQLSISRRVAGVGSLGRPRFVALAEWRGGKVAREVKATAPSACYFGSEGAAPESAIERMLHAPLRVPDPFVKVDGHWLSRRLAPDCSRVELGDLPRERDERRLMQAMGAEAANAQLGDGRARDVLLREFEALPRKWLSDAARRMCKVVLADFEIWKSVHAG